MRVYPADKQGMCLHGFCPTICSEQDAMPTALKLAADMKKHGFDYDHIVFEED